MRRPIQHGIIFTILVFAMCLSGCDNSWLIPERSVYQNVLTTLSQDNPGFSYEPGHEDRLRHYPMSYALFASAEAHRADMTENPIALNNALQAAHWLIEHADLDGDGEVGWGLPYPWDAGGDGSINPPHTEYTITTALVIQGLLDVYDALTNEKTNQVMKSRILNTSARAAETFLADRYDTLAQGEMIAFWFSSRSEDDYYAINPTAMLVGQLQRLSQYGLPNSKELQKYADMGVKFIMDQRKYTAGRVYWMYYAVRLPGMELPNRPDDLLHTAYTYQGLIDYRLYGGEYGHLIEPTGLLQSISSFVQSGKLFKYRQDYAFPESLKEVAERWARVRAAGFGLKVTRMLETCLTQPHDLSKQIYGIIMKNYKHETGWRIFPSEERQELFSRDIAHLLVGLSWYNHDQALCRNPVEDAP